MEGRRWGSRSAKDRDKKGYIGMLGQRQVTPSWAGDTVRRHEGRQ